MEKTKQWLLGSSGPHGPTAYHGSENFVVVVEETKEDNAIIR
jgi:hypothetical protein